MSWVYRHLVRPLLFAQDAEEIHKRTMRALAWASRHEMVCDALESLFGAPPMPIELFGLKFPNPLGLAAGMDKYADAVPVWSALGFGFTELGAITWHPQPGNPQPRLFRVPGDEAIINRMGFNNPGAEAVAQKLAHWRALGRWPRHPVGINLGKSKITLLDKAAEDYANSFRVLQPHADFFVVNVSSPNTPNLRQLQDKAALDEILSAMDEVSSTLHSPPPASPAPPRHPSPVTRHSSSPVPRHPSLVTRQSPATRHTSKPILIKIAPDLSLEALDEILDVVSAHQIAGI